MKLGLMIWTFVRPLGSPLEPRKETTLKEVLEIAASLGLQGLELQDSCGFEEIFPNVPSKKRLKELKETADLLEVEIPAISAMAGSLLEPNIDDQIAYIERWLELASSIGTKILKLNVGLKPQEMSKEQAFERAKDCIKRCLRLAEEYGIVLAPELWPPRSFPSNDPIAMITLMKVIDSKYFRPTIDNDFLPPDWAVTAYKLLAPYVTHVHASVYEESYMRRIDRGKFEFEEFISTLKNVDYKGYVMIEWKGANATVAECVKGLEKSAAMLRKLITP